MKGTFATRGHEHQRDAWIDHIIYWGNAAQIRPLGAFNSVEAGWKVASDYWPLWTAFQSAMPTTSMPVRPKKSHKRPEIPLDDHRQVAEFQHTLDTIIWKIPYTGDSYAEAEEYLNNITEFIVDTAALTNANNRKRARDKYKDGVSPQFLLTSWHLQIVIEIRR